MLATPRGERLRLKAEKALGLFVFRVNQITTKENTMKKHPVAKATKGKAHVRKARSRKRHSKKLAIKA